MMTANKINRPPLYLLISALCMFIVVKSAKIEDYQK